VALARDPGLWTARVSSSAQRLCEVKRGSHRFEVNYQDRLVGELAETGACGTPPSLMSERPRSCPVVSWHRRQGRALSTVGRVCRGSGAMVESPTWSLTRGRALFLKEPARYGRENRPISGQVRGLPSAALARPRVAIGPQRSQAALKLPCSR
jgi:hypothetical protein